MRISTSLLPELVWYKCYTECTIEQALLRSFIDAPDNILSLPDIWKIKVNGNRLLWSYWHAIMTLRRKGYNIKMKSYHHPKKKITCVTYELKNPTHNPSESDLFNQI